jgi:hypothetical protein
LAEIPASSSLPPQWQHLFEPTSHSNTVVLGLAAFVFGAWILKHIFLTMMGMAL